MWHTGSVTVDDGELTREAPASRLNISIVWKTPRSQIYPRTHQHRLLHQRRAVAIRYNRLTHHQAHIRFTFAAGPPHLAPVFYIDQSGIILAKVGTGRDISRPKNPRSGPVGTGRDISRPTKHRSGLSADVGIGLVKKVDFAENSLHLYKDTTSFHTSTRDLK